MSVGKRTVLDRKHVFIAFVFLWS